MSEHETIEHTREDLPPKRPRREFLARTVRSTAGLLLLPAAVRSASADDRVSLTERPDNDVPSIAGPQEHGAVFNIRDFGAVPGQDSSAPIQAAVRAMVSAGGGMVYVPAGTYLITSPIAIGGNGNTTGPNVAFTGDGPHRSLIKNIGMGNAIDINMRWSSPPGPYFDFWWFPRISGLEIVGGPGSGRGINIRSAHTIVIDDCWIHGHGREGVYAENAYVLTMRDSYVCNCGSAGAFHGIHLRNFGHLTRFFGCSSSNHTGSGFYLNDISNSLSLIGCDAEGNRGYGMEIGSCGGTVIHGGYLENNGPGDIHLWNAGCGADIRGMYMNGTATVGIYIEEFLGAEISGCTCSSSHETFVRLKNRDSRDVHIGKNHSSATYYVDGPTAGVYPWEVTSLHIEQCEFSGQPYAIMPTSQGDGNSNRRIWWLRSPSTGVWDNVGDIVYRLDPMPGGNIGWVCTTNGAPGTWKMFGAIAS